MSRKGKYNNSLSTPILLGGLLFVTLIIALSILSQKQPNILLSTKRINLYPEAKEISKKKKNLDNEQVKFSEIASRNKEIAGPRQTNINAPSLQEPARQNLELDVKKPKKIASHDHLNSIRPYVVFSIGKLNGLPQSNTDALIKDEFTNLSPSNNIVHIEHNKHFEFPQKILPNQTIVIHLRDIPQENLKLYIRASKTNFNSNNDYPDFDSRCLKVSYNNTLVWNSTFTSNAYTIKSLIPLHYNEEFENTLTISNTGKLEVAFDSIWIVFYRKEKPFVIESQHNSSTVAGLKNFIPPQSSPTKYIKNFNFEILSSIQQNNLNDRNSDYFNEDYGTTINKSTTSSEVANSKFLIEQKSLRHIHQFTEWFQRGGNRIVLNNILGYESYFSPLTHIPNLDGYHLLKVSAGLLGNKNPHFVNIFNADKNNGSQALRGVNWFAVSDKNELRLIVSNNGLCKSPEKIRIVTALPWSGEAILDYTHGISPQSFKFSDRIETSEFKDIKVLDNQIDIILPLNGLLVLKCTKFGSGFSYLKYDSLVKSNFINRKGILKSNISHKRIDNSMSIKQIPNSLLNVSYLDFNTELKISEVNSTYSTIENIENITPINSKSLLIQSILLKNENSSKEVFCIKSSSFLNQSQYLSFWVKPKSNSDIKKAHLGVSIGGYLTDLSLNIDNWQRVQIQIPKNALTKFVSFYRKKLTSNDESIAYELNGLSLANTRKLNYLKYEKSSELISINLETDLPEFSYRTSFLKPTKVKKIIFNGKELNPSFWNYDSSSQLLSIGENQNLLLNSPNVQISIEREL